MTGPRRRKRALSDEEKALWRKAVSKAEPLRPDPPEFVEIVEPPKPRDLRERRSIAPFRAGEASPAPAPEIRLQPGIAERFAKVSPNMDRKNFDRLIRGKKPLDAVLDLHGMTLAEAHPRLIAFVRDAGHSGKRLLLVITGKGKTDADAGIMPARRGVLKHQVPEWLRSPPLSSLVLQVTQAHGKHGGSGAYYVYLRRRR